MRGRAARLALPGYTRAMKGEPLSCQHCGAALTNEALVSGACSYCQAALQLPNDPGKRNQGRVISTAGDRMVLRIDGPGGTRVETFDDVVWGPQTDAERPETPREPARKSSLSFVVVVFLVVLAIAGLAVFILMD